MIKPEIVPFQKGMTLGFYARRGVYASPWIREEIKKIQRLGCEYICLVVTVFRETDYSSREFADFEETPGELETGKLIDFIHSLGMKVMLRPMLESHDGNGRLQVYFAYDRERIPGKKSTAWARWFKSLRARTQVYASLAREFQCEIYGLDSELDYTVDHSDSWNEVLEVARENFPGLITTSHTDRVDFEKVLTDENHWFRNLDFLQTSFYTPAEKEPGASVAEMEQALRPERERFRRIAGLLRKPLMFGECGCTSSTGGAMAPSSWSANGKFAPEEQANYLQAVWNLFRDEPYFRGLYWWKWDEQNYRAEFHTDPKGDKGFGIDGKLAADVMKSLQIPKVK